MNLAHRRLICGPRLEQQRRSAKRVLGCAGRIKREFDAAGISFPYPQMDVTLSG